jgi:alcohol dehydrogenase class IV
MHRSINPFVYTPTPCRVVFGAGGLREVGAEVDALGARRALVLSTAGQSAAAHRVAELLGGRSVGVCTLATMHVPSEVARQAVEQAHGCRADCAVSIGGGSTTGLGKAIALETGVPLVAIPTTYAGSEVTPIWGVTSGGVKRTGRDPRVLPRTVIYDPELTLSLPAAVSVTSAINAIAHAAEGLYAHDVNPVVALMAEEGIRAATSALQRLPTAPADIDARSDALYAAWLCGTVLGSVAMGLHHKLCHTLGGSFDLPHAEVHAVVLPHALAYNAAHAPQAMASIARALSGAGISADAGSVPQSLQALSRRVGAPTSLRAIGMPAQGLDRAANLAVTHRYPNPRPLERDALRALLQRAFDGSPAR